MGEAYDPTNLPTLPDGSPNPDFEWKAPPGYTGPSPQEQALAQGLQYGGPGQQYQQGTQALLQALTQGGGYSAVQPHLKNLMKFAMGGKRMGEDYTKAGLQATRKGAMEGMNVLRGQQGQAGGLGSTIAGLSDASLLSEALTQANQVRATGTQMGEQAMMSRLMGGAQGLSNLGGLANAQMMNILQGGQALAGLGLQEQQMGHGFDMDALGALDYQRMQPAQWAYQNWRANQQAPKGGGALPYITAAADIASSFLPIPGGGGGDGGITPYTPRGASGDWGGFQYSTPQGQFGSQNPWYNSGGFGSGGAFPGWGG